MTFRRGKELARYTVFKERRRPARNRENRSRARAYVFDQEL
jgi:hypothetical protein